MEAKPREILIFENADGKMPWSDWMDGLIDDPIYGIILTRIDRVETGLFGDREAVGEGVSELKIDFGPGYRVYFGEFDDMVVLLGGGTKKTQARDIVAAKDCWRLFNADKK